MKKLIRMISLLLTFTLLLGLMVPASASAPKEVTYTTYQGYDIAILYNDVNGTAYQIEEDSLIYTLYVNKLTNELTLKAKNFRVSFLGMRFFPVTETYDVYLNSVEVNGRVTASFVSQKDPDKVFDLDTSDAVAQFAVAIAAGGIYALVTGVCSAILLCYLLAAATIVVAGITYELASDVIKALKKYQSSIHYYMAIRPSWSNKVWVGPALSDAEALGFARSKLNSSECGIFAISSTYSRNLAVKASPIKTASPAKIHGSGSDYFWHYHPMKDYKTQCHLHIWYI